MAVPNPDTRPTAKPRTRAAWRAWLQKNHERQSEVWLISDKRHTGRSAIRIEDAIEEALCFGWIDSTIRRIDNETFARKFSRRRPGSEWSQLNVKRVRKLIERGLMTPAGLSAFEAPSRPADRMAPRDAPLQPPPDLARAIRGNARAEALYARFPPGAKRHYHAWILNAKQPATRARRVAEAVERIANNERSLLK
jgi:uncharacterized protein YdeI (YjbR/CyaY-like superfamily)